MFKYLIAVSMMVSGVTTILADPIPESNLAIIYETKATLVVFGIIFFVLGVALFVSKLFKWKRIQGWSLFGIYVSYMFAFFSNWIGLGWDSAWGNLILAIIMGGLYLRWKYHIYYYDAVDKRHKLRYSSTTTE